MILTYIILSENNKLPKNTWCMIPSMQIFKPENNTTSYLGQHIYVEKDKYIHGNSHDQMQGSAGVRTKGVDRM